MSKQALISFLQEENNKVLHFEAEGEKARATNDAKTYCAFLKEKALLLSNIFIATTPYLANFSQGEVAPIVNRIKGFSTSANNALKLNSSFYMSALLYPEDHKPGEPNDLELFIQSLKK